MGVCHLQAGALSLDEEVFSGRLRQRASELEALANERIDAGRSNLATVIVNVFQPRSLARKITRCGLSEVVSWRIFPS